MTGTNNQRKNSNACGDTLRARTVQLSTEPVFAETANTDAFAQHAETLIVPSCPACGRGFVNPAALGHFRICRTCPYRIVSPANLGIANHADGSAQ